MAGMEREAVESEAIRSIGYDAGRRVLEIEFSSGAVYEYLDVPAHVHLDLMQAGSTGEAFAHCVRNAGFEYRLLRAPD